MNKTTTHTPGPWIISNDAVLQVIDIKSRHALGENVAFIAHTAAYEADTHFADAQLIAEAPAMFDALTAIATQAELTARTFPNAPGRGDVSEIAQIARNALARAKVVPV